MDDRDEDDRIRREFAAAQHYLDVAIKAHDAGKEEECAAACVMVALALDVKIG